MKKMLGRLIIFVIIIVAYVCVLGCGGGSDGSDRHGDGVSTCKNCGKEEVYALGFCERCYRSFSEYTYGK